MATTPQWIRRAREAVLVVLENEYSCTSGELQARIGEPRDITGPVPDLLATFGVKRIDPYFVNLARTELHRAGLIDSTTEATRGGKEIETFHLPLTDGDGRKDATERAASRKRLLAARHQGYARSEPTRPEGLIGQAGELVVDEALKASPHFAVINDGSTHRRYVLGIDLEDHGGPIDNLANLTTSDQRGNIANFVCPVEVKNHREWTNPDRQPLHRFLAKTAAISIETKRQDILPMFICRRYRYPVFRIATDLGFFMVGFINQFIRDLAEVDQDKLEEVRNELGYGFLLKSDQPNKPLTNTLAAVPKYAQTNADRWATIGSQLGHHYQDLAKDSPPRDRSEIMNDLEADAIELGAAGDWYKPPKR